MTSVSKNIVKVSLEGEGWGAITANSEREKVLTSLQSVKKWKSHTLGAFMYILFNIQFSL